MSVKTSLNQVGFINITKQADSLQGSVYKAFNKFTKEEVVIKRTNKYLHKNGIAVANNKKFHGIKENILSEAAIMKYLSENERTPASIVKFCDFFECSTNYYLVMQFGGGDLFDFVVKAHRLIESGHITINEWLTVVKIIFKQMIEAIEFIHSQNVCHYDVSIENFLINDVQIRYFENVNTKQSKIRFVHSDIRIKLIDFGLSEHFNAKKGFKSAKKCGKNAYKSPELFSKKTFDARSNDIWCLGVCLWMCVFGISPWKKAVVTDEIFVLIMSGHITEVLRSWDKLSYASPELIDLLQSFFRFEKGRICLKEIKQHSWFRSG